MSGNRVGGRRGANGQRLLDDKQGVPEAVTPKISQETLAEMVGTTHSRVSFFMNRFRKLGFVDYHRGAL